MVDVLAQKVEVDKAEIRLRNFITPEQFPYTSCLGWDYDSGDYPTALKKALDAVGYDALRQEQAEKRARGELMGIGVVTFTEIVGAGPMRNCDILGLGMFDSCEIRVHPTGSVIARLGTKSQGQGHSSASRPTTSPSRKATPIPRPTAWAPTARARRRWPAPRRPRRPGNCGRRPIRSPPTCSRSAPTTWNGRSTASR
jgi:hypothetical protein